MPDPEKTKKIKKKPEDPFEAAGDSVFQVLRSVEKIVNGIPESSRSHPSYKLIIDTIRSGVENALDPNYRKEHKQPTWWSRTVDVCTFIVKNPVFLAIICVILGALIGNLELLKTILQFIKG